MTLSNGVLAGVELDVDGGRIAFEVCAGSEIYRGKPDGLVGRRSECRARPSNSTDGRRQRAAQMRTALDGSSETASGTNTFMSFGSTLLSAALQIEVRRELAVNLENGALRAETKSSMRSTGA